MDSTHPNNNNSIIITSPLPSINSPAETPHPTMTMTVPMTHSSSSRPSYIDMILNVLRERKDRNGTSQHFIAKHITSKYFIGDEINKQAFSKALRAAVKQKKLLRPPNRGNTYKLNADYEKEVKIQARAKKAAADKKKRDAVKKRKLMLKEKEKVKEKLQAQKEKEKLQEKKEKQVQLQLQKNWNGSHSKQKQMQLQYQLDLKQKQLQLQQEKKQMLQEREKRLIKNKMEDLALMQEDKEFGVSHAKKGFKLPFTEGLLLPFPHTHMNISAKSKISNRCRIARFHAAECVDVSIRCWDILFGSVNLVKFLNGGKDVNDNEDVNNAATASSNNIGNQRRKGTASFDLPALTFENFVHTFAQCNEDEAPDTIYLLLNWCLGHLLVLRSDDRLSDVPRNSSTIIHVTKLYVMDQLHRRRHKIRHEMDDQDEDEVEDDDEEDEQSMEKDDDSSDGDEEDDLTRDILTELFPMDSGPNFHKILLFLCEDLLDLPVVANELTKRVALRSDFVKQLRSADYARKRARSQWKAQNNNSNNSNNNGNNSNDNAKKQKVKEDSDVDNNANNKNKENMNGNKKSSAKPLLSKKEYHGAIGEYEKVVKQRWDDEFSIRLDALGQDRYFRSYYFIPKQGILVLEASEGDLEWKGKTYKNAFLLKTPEHLQELIDSLDERGQRESILKDSLTRYEGLTQLLPGEFLSPIEKKIAELRVNLETTSSTRVRENLVSDISKLEAQLVPTREDLSGESKLVSIEGIHKLFVNDDFSSSCKALISLLKRVTRILADDELENIVETLKELKGNNSTGEQNRWMMIVNTLQRIHSLLYDRSLLSLTDEHNKFKPKAPRYATLLTKICQMPVTSIVAIRKLLVEAISDLKVHINKRKSNITTDMSSQVEDNLIDNNNEIMNDEGNVPLSQLFTECKRALRLWSRTSANATQSAIRNLLAIFEIEDLTVGPVNDEILMKSSRKASEGAFHYGQVSVAKTALECDVLFDAFDNDGTEWIEFLLTVARKKRSRCNDSILCTAVYVFELLVNDLLIDIEEGSSLTREQLDWFSLHANKRSTRQQSKTNDEDSNTLENDAVVLPPNNKNTSSPWLHCVPTNEFVFVKGILPDPFIPWPARVLEVVDDDLEHEMKVTGVTAVVPLECTMDNVIIQLARTDHCMPMEQFDDTVINTIMQKYGDNKKNIDHHSKLWRECYNIMSRMKSQVSSSPSSYSSVNTCEEKKESE